MGFSFSISGLMSLSPVFRRLLLILIDVDSFRKVPKVENFKVIIKSAQFAMKSVSLTKIHA